jgi:hypothetical protein
MKAQHHNEAALWIVPPRDPRRMTTAQLKRFQKAPMRLERIERLKALRAPAWIIKMEEVAYALNINGMVAPGLGGESSGTAQRLFDEKVLPLMGDPL